VYGNAGMKIVVEYKEGKPMFHMRGVLPIVIKRYLKVD
jgi:hypothetical protein